MCLYTGVYNSKKYVALCFLYRLFNKTSHGIKILYSMVINTIRSQPKTNEIIYLSFMFWVNVYTFYAQENLSKQCCV